MRELWLQPLDYWRSGGPLVIPIALVCFGIWFTFWRLRTRLRHGIADADAVIVALPEWFSEHGDPADVGRWCRLRPAGLTLAVGRVLGAIVAGVPLHHALAEHIDPVRDEARRDLRLLRALTGVAPLLGLLGTVLGMVITFRAVGGQNVSARVAAGISSALITTQFGLVVAIPGVFGISRVGRLLAHFEARLSVCRTRLVIELERQRGESELAA